VVVEQFNGGFASDVSRERGDVRQHASFRHLASCHSMAVVQDYKSCLVPGIRLPEDGKAEGREKGGKRRERRLVCCLLT
jgi:hypothetical protein